MAGFLPPEDGTGRGKGHVSYLVEPRPGLATGDSIRAVALIHVDARPAIATDQADLDDPGLGVDPARMALNTIDDGPPSSRVAALPATTAATSFLVSWSGEDDPGVRGSVSTMSSSRPTAARSSPG